MVNKRSVFIPDIYKYGKQKRTTYMFNTSSFLYMHLFAQCLDQYAKPRFSIYLRHKLRLTAYLQYVVNQQIKSKCLFMIHLGYIQQNMVGINNLKRQITLYKNSVTPVRLRFSSQNDGMDELSITNYQFSGSEE